MSTKVTINVVDEDLEYSHSPWDAADMALYHVNKILKERGIDIKFEVNNCDDDEYLEEYWNAEHPNYNGGVIIEESESKDDCDFMDKLI